MKKNFAPLLLGRDLRSISRGREVVRSVTNQQDFDELFNLLLHHERLLVVRAADAIENITVTNRKFLAPHKKQLLTLLKSTIHLELKRHLALLVSRLDLSTDELKEVWGILSYWALNPNERKIVRVNALQGLFELSVQFSDFCDSFQHTLQTLEHEQIPSLQARIKRLRKAAVVLKKQVNLQAGVSDHGH